jgi:ferritin-like metal-binding protein YciE
MNLKSLNALYVLELHALYNAEQQILKALPRLIDAAHSAELKNALTTHRDETRLHVNRLEEVFDMHAESPKGEASPGIEAILKEGDQLLKAHADNAVRDAAIISAAQRVEHYEIALYGCVRTWAEQLGFDRAAQVLETTLREEERADQILTTVAKSKVNVEAAHSAG